MASRLVNFTNRHIFLTGKAGTGKTTFLKWIRENCHKEMAIVAPTGVAAINAGGVTIHSFFQLPFSPFIPGAGGAEGDQVIGTQSLLGQLRLTGEKRKVIRELELLIIDEVSMVRCDTLDAIDLVLRHVRRRPHETFGGVQVLFIGDLYQLPPVIPEQEWTILSRFYPAPYFFNSRCIHQSPPVYVEFTRIYRQNEEQFINLLNMIRNDTLDENGKALLESRYNPGFRRHKDDGYIILTTHNRKADAINEKALNEIDGSVHGYMAEVEGDFSEKSFPADERLLLKVGAQVMFIKNDVEKPRRYYNGRIGIVTKLEKDKIFVKCDGDDEAIEVKKETWENIRYVLDSKTNKLEEDVLGSFVQYPLRLAWAITIHKSQGLTFEKAIVDAGDAFAPGQVYVALSRCMSLDGLVLHTRINGSALGGDSRVIEYTKSKAIDPDLNDLLEQGRAGYERETLSAVFDFNREIHCCDDLMVYCSEHVKSFTTNVLNWLTGMKALVQECVEVGDKFRLQLARIYSMPHPERGLLLSRVNAASGFFGPRMDSLIKYIQSCDVYTDSSQHAKTFNNDLKEVFLLISLKHYLCDYLAKDFSVADFLERKSRFRVPSFSINTHASAAKARTDSPHPELLRKLKALRDSLCAKLSLPIYLVANSNSLFEMSRYLPRKLDELKEITGFGEVKLEKFGQSFLEIINQYCEDNGLDSLIHEKPKKKTRESADKKSKTEDTRELSFKLFREGYSIPEIARTRNLATNTIEGHLASYIERGDLDIAEVLNQERISMIEPFVVVNAGNGSLKAIKESCGADVSYGEIKMVLAWKESQRPGDEANGI